METWTYFLYVVIFAGCSVMGACFFFKSANKLVIGRDKKLFYRVCYGDQVLASNYIFLNDDQIYRVGFGDRYCHNNLSLNGLIENIQGATLPEQKALEERLQRYLRWFELVSQKGALEIRASYLGQNEPHKDIFLRGQDGELRTLPSRGADFNAVSQGEGDEGRSLVLCVAEDIPMTISITYFPEA